MLAVDVGRGLCHHFFLFLHSLFLHIYHMYLDGQARANSVNPDEMPQNAASPQGLHCLPLIQQLLDTTMGSILSEVSEYLG